MPVADLVEHADRAERADPNALAGPASAAAFQLRFDSLFHEGRALAFPCDGVGRVRIDGLSARARQLLLRARRCRARVRAAARRGSALSRGGGRRARVGPPGARDALAHDAR